MRISHITMMFSENFLTSANRISQRSFDGALKQFSGELRKKTVQCFCLRTIGLIVAPWKFDVLKTSIFALEALLFLANISF